MRKQLRAAAVMVGVMASGGAWAGPEESGEGARRTPTTELPSPIAHSLKARFPDATVAAVERVGSGWEASILDGLRRQDVILDADGNLVEQHTPMPVRALPEGLRATLDRSHPRHTLWRATEITTEIGVFHEVLLARGDRRSVVLFDPMGKALADVRRS
ncbi:MAG: hypothetical protein Q8P18_25565 [Pseudomonadota bacterium]|nr:hypothetical protein [Pseudomonadota bacterium]